MAGRARRGGARSAGRPPRAGRKGGLATSITPEVARSLVGILLLVLGAVTLVALALPGQGKLTDLFRDWVVPWFGVGRWVLPFLLLLAGWYVEWGPGRRSRSGWQVTLLGAVLAFVAALGLIRLARGSGGGRIGIFVGDLLAGLLTTPGALIVLAGLCVAGILVALNTPLRTLVGPLGRGARGISGILAAAAPGPEIEPSGSGPGAPVGAGSRTAGVSRPVSAAPGQAGIWPGDGGPGAGGGGRPGDAPGRGGIPAAVPSSAPMSATFAPAAGDASAGLRPATSAIAIAERPLEVQPGRIVSPRDPEDVTDAGDAPPTRNERAYRLPPLSLLAEGDRGPDGAAMDHARNASIIMAKLESFNIPARVIRWNAGPVVTQYEIDPDPSVKVSRIEGLADDLAMALAARTIRIEAPIPGKSVVGLEIPNSDFNVVALRRIFEEVDFLASGSRLTFALGRDVAGHARAVDLARMPHLLIAGATGSGKSVMVNALITSLLCQATPDEVRLILIDLKRVELAPYNGLPHLMVPVVTEPERAKVALKWTVGEMEARYRRFAMASARNIAGYNESRADPTDRLPSLVVVVDELADLMMREGKNVEDPIVRLAQKARATGIHLVLATQRPSVNVVTGLIKANFPSRIAFAMSSQIDSRTILDAPGAEDLIGRGDMLYQPSDLPRPVRMQGVFVSDKEIAAITEHWRAEAEPHYDLSIVEDDEAGASSDDLSDEEADRLLPDAVGVVQEYDRASASLLQRRLRIGYARAARIIDQLEARGYIGAFDGSNARVVLRREGGAGGSARVERTIGDEAG